jgi:hypothetical protein
VQEIASFLPCPKANLAHLSVPDSTDGKIFHPNNVFVDKQRDHFLATKDRKVSQNRTTKEVIYLIYFRNVHKIALRYPVQKADLLTNFMRG